MRRKLTPRQKLILENDWITASIVKARDSSTCQVCNKVVSGHNCQACHIIPRAHFATRFDIKNIFTGCFACHRKWHSDPFFSTAWATQHFGKKYLTELQAKDVIVKVDMDFLESWNKKLKDQYLKQTGFKWGK